MKSIDLRHLIILAISLTGLILSIYFLSPTKLDSEFAPNLKLAILEEATNQILRQKVSSIVWDNIEPGEYLSLGEKVRTKENANAIIKFLKNDTKITLTKNSTIIIEDSGNNYKLRLIEGNLYVKNTDASKNELEIITGKTGNETIKLNNAEALLSVTETGKAEVNLIKGNINATKAIKVNDSSFFGDIYPNYGETIYLSPTENVSLVNLKNKNQSIIQFSNQNFKKFNYNLELQNTDETKKESYKLDENFNLPIQRIQASYTWKLIAKELETNSVTESATMKFFVKQVEIPVPQYPNEGETLRFIENKNIKTEFKWILPTPLDQIEIEISKDKTFTTNLIKEKVTVKTYYETESLNEEGEYFWRIKGVLKNQQTSLKNEILSDTYSFKLKKGLKLSTPMIISPLNKQIFYRENNNTNTSIILTWKDVKDATTYTVNLKNNGVATNLQAKQNFLELNNLNLGKYNWTVNAQNQKDVASDFSESFEFAILPNKELKILTKNFNTHYYTDKIKDLIIEWEKIEDVKNYEILISESEILQNPRSQSTLSNKATISFDNKNPIYLKILGKNSLNETMGSTKVVKITPVFIPIPLAPKFTTNNTTLIADKSGSITVNLVPNENKYPLLTYYLVNKATLTKNEWQTNGDSSSITLNDLLPGNYELTAFYIDQDQRKGLESRAIEIIVKNESNLTAPKIKKVNIK